MVLRLVLRNPTTLLWPESDLKFRGREEEGRHYIREALHTTPTHGDVVHPHATEPPRSLFDSHER